MDIVDLPSSAKFSDDSLNYRSGIIFDNVCLNRMSVLRRFFNYRHITDSAHSHIKGSRNRRCGKHKNIDSVEIFFEFFLVSNSETLFFVYDSKTQILEHHAFLDYFMRSDKDVNSSLFELFDYLFLLFRTAVT